MTQIAIVGNLTSDPELRFTQSGAAVVNFTIAETPRVYDKTTGEWKDGEATFWRCSLWRTAAENLAESLAKGSRVVAVGETQTRTFESNGESKSVIEVKIEEIGPSLRYATAKPVKINRGGGTQPSGAWPASTDEAPF